MAGLLQSSAEGIGGFDNLQSTCQIIDILHLLGAVYWYTEHFHTYLQELLGRYALPVLADYVATTGLSSQARASREIKSDLGDDNSLASRTAAPLRQAACALYGVCSPSQVPNLTFPGRPIASSSV